MNAMTTMAPVGSIRSASPSGQGGAIASKWKLLKAVEDAREPLGLKRTSLALLRTMIALVQSDHIDAVAADKHICFASNSTLSERVHVSVKTVERHITALAEAGLVRRIVSGNGKRWARRDGQGRVVLASGLSLLPLAEKHAELIVVGQEHAEKIQQARLLKDKCSMHLRRLKDLQGEEGLVTDLIIRTRKLLRRKNDTQALKDLLDELSNELASCGYVEDQAAISRASDDHIEGHKETDLIQKVKEKKSSEIQVTSEEMERSFPKLCAELRFARSKEHCDRMMVGLASYLGISDVWIDLKAEQGPAVSFMILGYLLQRADHIQNHKAYFHSLEQKIKAGEIKPRSLLKATSQKARRQ